MPHCTFPDIPAEARIQRYQAIYKGQGTGFPLPRE
jgi:hypothetical protein